MKIFVDQKKGALTKNFVKFTEKHLCQTLFFNKSYRPNFAKFLRALFFTEHFRRLLLYGNGTGIEFELKLNTNLFRQRTKKVAKLSKLS